MVLESPGSCWEMIWNIKKTAVKQFTHFSYEILMVSESQGSCLKSAGGCREADYKRFQ